MRAGGVGALARAAALACALAAAAPVLGAGEERLPLPAPRLDGGLALERALQQRRSLREFDDRALTLAEVSQLLWAAQGLDATGTRRTAPSAGALYPLTLWLVAGRVDGRRSGIYRYAPEGHALQAGPGGDRRAAVAAAARDQRWLASAPALVVISADLQRSRVRYGERAERYAQFEAGAAAQNLALQAVALGLGATVVGAFDEDALRSALALPSPQVPVVILPVGRPR